MLSDPREIEIIAKARQKNVRDPARSRVHFERIFTDFFPSVEMHGSRLLDLGPGHYDFGVLARARGAAVTGIDNDPAVLELGRYKGFDVHELRLQALRAGQFAGRFDGLFCKFSLNAFWFWDDAVLHERWIGELIGVLRADAWGWVAPWNGLPKGITPESDPVAHTLTVQAKAFAAYGFSAFELTDELSRYYGVHGATANHALFLRGLPVPKRLRGRRVNQPRTAAE